MWNNKVNKSTFIATAVFTAAVVFVCIAVFFAARHDAVGRVENMCGVDIPGGTKVVSYESDIIGGTSAQKTVAWLIIPEDKRQDFFDGIKNKWGKPPMDEVTKQVIDLSKGMTDVPFYGRVTELTGNYRYVYFSEDRYAKLFPGIDAPFYERSDIFHTVCFYGIDTGEVLYFEFDS